MQSLKLKWILLTLQVAVVHTFPDILRRTFFNSFHTVSISAFDLILLGKIGVDELKVLPLTHNMAFQFDEVHNLQHYQNSVVIFSFDANGTNEELDAVLTSTTQSRCSTQSYKNRDVIILICEEEQLSPLLNIVISLSHSWCLDLKSQLFLIPIKKASVKSCDFNITEIYNIKNITIFNTFKLKNCRQNFDYLLQELRQIVTRRANLRGVRVIGVSEVKQGLVEIDPNGKISFRGGYNVEEYRCLRDALNFTEATVPWKGYVGLSSNGSLTGMGQQVNDGEADISIQSQEILPYRGARLTFLIPNLNNIEKLYAFFQQRRTTAQGNIFIQTVSPEVWIVAMVTWGLLTVSILAIHRIINGFEFSSHESSSVARHVWMWGLAAICQKGWHAMPSKTSLRIIVLIGLLASSIFYQAFCASLVSLLSVPSVLIHSFSDLLKYEFRLYTEKDTNSAISLVQKLKYGNVSRNVTSLKYAVGAEQGLVKILNSKSAFISPIYLFYPKLQSDIYSSAFLCKHVTKEDAHHSSTKSGMFIKKDSPYKELFYYKLMQMAESGIRHRLSKRYRVDGVQLNCLAEDNKSARDSIDLMEVFAAFVFLIVGIPASTCILLIELHQKKRTLTQVF